MRIGYNCRFIHAARETGVERYARNLLAALVDSGSDDEFVLFGCGERKPFDSPPPNVRLVGSCESWSAIARHLWEQAALPRLARESGASVLLNPINTAPVAFPRNIIVVHDLAFLEHPEWFSGGFQRLYRMVVPRAVRRACAVMTVSEFSKSRIVELLKVPAEKVHVVYQGKDPAFVPAEPEKVRMVQGRLGIERPYLLYVGSITPRKNLAGVSSAFNIARSRLPEHELVVAGVAGVQFPKVDSRSVRADGVRCLGYTTDEDLPALYTGADALVYPSLYEGFGLPPLEAMACGTPVITSSVSSLPEVVGDAAVLIDPTNVEEIADAMVRVVTDGELAHNLRARGLERAKMFSWEETAIRTLDICRRIGDNHSI